MNSEEKTRLRIKNAPLAQLLASLAEEERSLKEELVDYNTQNVEDVEPNNELN